MAISSDYPRPINVNGFVCRNCDDVSDAKRFIDPAVRDTPPQFQPVEDDAVQFGGTLSSRRNGADLGDTSSLQVPRRVDRLA